MSSPSLDVERLAHLARLTLTPEERGLIGDQLNTILRYMEKLNELEVEGIEPTAHAVPLVNVTRPDEVEVSLPRNEALANAPAGADGLFLVPRILE